MIQILVPMGGAGRSLEEASPFPKPLIEIDGKPMIEIVTQNITPKENHRFIFLCREEQLRQFALAEVLKLITTAPVILESKQTAGALCTTLLAVDEIDPEEELLIAAADQFVDIDINAFLSHARSGDWDGQMIVFPSTHPKWSYARLENGVVVEVAEKRPISRLASAGIYYYRRAGDYIEAAKNMIRKNASTVGEFYICPAFNESILAGKRIGVFPIERSQMYSFDTFESIDTFVGMKGQLLEHSEC